MLELLKAMIQRGASDLHLTAGSPPQLRIDGNLVPLQERSVLRPADLEKLLGQITREEQMQRFARDLELDFSFSLEGLSRFRVNLFVQRGSMAAAIRAIPFHVPQFADLGLPESVLELSRHHSGLVLVTGGTGSGKSTTLASLIDEINRNRAAHIITIEDPIEFIHPHRLSIVNQRQIGDDSLSFAEALRHVLRQDPDVVLIGEMRDLETIETALKIAETGHLVLASLHTNSCAQAISRMIDVFPATQQSQVSVQISLALVGVVTQSLVPRLDGGRVVATEVMLGTPAILGMIRDNKIHQIQNLLMSGRNTGMHTMNQSLMQLVADGIISEENALKYTPDAEGLRLLLKM
jgi:twitching motility protein PilT